MQLNYIDYNIGYMVFYGVMVYSVLLNNNSKHLTVFCRIRNNNILLRPKVIFQIKKYFYGGRPGTSLLSLPPDKQ